MNTIRSIALLLTLGSLSAMPRAQNLDGPYWSEYPVPTAGVTSFRSIGSTGVIQSPTDMHFFSGITRQWVVQPVSAAATFQIANSYCIAQDGTTFHGFASRNGAVRTLVGSPAATLNIGSASSSWIAYVQDGNTIYGWSAFHGEWLPLPLANPPQQVLLGSHALLVVAAGTAYAMSPYFGTWVAEPVPAGGTYSTFNAGAIGRWAGPDEVRAFSAYQNTWSTAPFAGAATATVVDKEGYALVQTGFGADTLAFSALRGSFQQLPTGPGTTWFTGPDVAVAVTPSATFGYAPGVDAFVALPPVTLAQPLSLAQGRFGCYALIDTGSSVLAFHGLTGATATAPAYAPNYSYAVGDAAAFVGAPAGGGIVYSALRNEWAVAPVTGPVSATAMFESVMLATGTDFVGYSARTGTFSALPANGSLQTQAAGSLAAVVGSNSLDVYDPVLARWNHIDTAAAPTLSVFRLTGVGHDGATGYGYSLFSNTWDTVALQGAITQSSANSSIGFIRTASHFYLYTANGSLSNLGRFPEFSRFVVRGGNYESLQVAAPGAFVVQAIGNPIEVPSPYGTLRVDLGTADLRFLGLVPASGVQRTVYPLPVDPAFAGLTVCVQDAVLTPSGGIYLTNAQQPYVW